MERSVTPSAWRLLAAWLLDLVLFAVTLGVGWLVWSYVLWARGTTPGRSLLGLTVYGTDTRRPCDRRRMAWRSVPLAGLALLLAVCSLGGSWVYGAAVAAGPRRRTLVDDWARTVVRRTPVAAPAVP